MEGVTGEPILPGCGTIQTRPADNNRNYNLVVSFWVVLGGGAVWLGRYRGSSRARRGIALASSISNNRQDEMGEGNPVMERPASTSYRLSALRWLARISTLAFLSAWHTPIAFASETQPILPVEAFASLPRETSISLSPDGKHLASKVVVDGTTYVLIRNLAEPDKTRPVFRTDNLSGSIGWLAWANDDLLLFGARFPAIRYGVDTVETRLFATDTTGSDVRNMFKFRSSRDTGAYTPQIQDTVIDFMPDDPNHILMSIRVDPQSGPDVYRVNVTNGKRKRVAKGRRDVTEWLTDRQHRPRLQIRLHEKMLTVAVKRLDTNKWDQLWQYEGFSDQAVHPLGFDADPNKLYVSAYHEGRLAVFKVDLAHPDLARELLLSHPEYDVSGRLLYSDLNKRVVGIRNSTEQNAYTVWDEEYEAFIAGLAKAMPDTTNHLLAMSGDERRYVLMATGPRTPGTLYFGDRDNRLLVPFGDQYPALKPDLLADRRPITYEARDGHLIEGFLTAPRQNQLPGPAVVLPHGGPISHDGQDFDYWAQFLANRGITVMQMNFRGSSGYGYAHMQAGLGSWADQIHNDITDGTHWLIDQEVADPERICILGGSFGGYAALLGAAREPTLYQCAAAFAPVTDLLSLRRRMGYYVGGKLNREQLGDSRRELRDASPVHLVDAVQAPILLIHGEADRVVDVKHSRAMHKALDRAGKAVDYIELDDGDHFLSAEEHRLDTFSRFEAFLRHHLF